jgi:hypothetical protein
MQTNQNMFLVRLKLKFMNMVQWLKGFPRKILGAIKRLPRFIALELAVPGNDQEFLQAQNYTRQAHLALTLINNLSRLH